MHAHTHVHCPLSLSLLLSIPAFVPPLADFAFADNRWADIDSLFNNKYTVCLTSLSLSVHLAVSAASLQRCNLFCSEMICPLSLSVVHQAQKLSETSTHSILSLHPLSCE